MRTSFQQLNTWNQKSAASLRGRFRCAGKAAFRVYKLRRGTMNLLADPSIPEPSNRVGNFLCSSSSLNARPLDQSIRSCSNALIICSSKDRRNAMLHCSPLTSSRYGRQITNPTQRNRTETETIAAIRDGVVAAAKGAVTGAVLRHAPTAHRLCTSLQWKKLL